jgi:hypothetical protein
MGRVPERLLERPVPGLCVHPSYLGIMPILFGLGLGGVHTSGRPKPAQPTGIAPGREYGSGRQRARVRAPGAYSAAPGLDQPHNSDEGLPPSYRLITRSPPLRRDEVGVLTCNDNAN